MFRPARFALALVASAAGGAAIAIPFLSITPWLAVAIVVLMISGGLAVVVDWWLPQPPVTTPILPPSVAEGWSPSNWVDRSAPQN